MLAASGWVVQDRALKDQATGENGSYGCIMAGTHMPKEPKARAVSRLGTGVSGTDRLSGHGLPETPPGTDADLAKIVQMILGPPGPRRSEARIRSEAWTAARIRHLARDVLGELRNKSESPSLREGLDRLDAISGLASQLARKLTALDATSLHLLKMDLPPVRAGQDAARIAASADHVARMVVAWSPDLGTHPLERIAGVAREARAVIERSAATQSGSGRKRGPEKLHQHVFGDMRCQAAYGAGKLLGSRQGAGVITSTEGGPLYSLVAAVWSYTTGLDAEHASLGHAVKRAVPALRLYLQNLENWKAARAAGIPLEPGDTVRLESGPLELLRRRPPSRRGRVPGRSDVSLP